jgi:hypothetical protein
VPVQRVLQLLAVFEDAVRAGDFAVDFDLAFR